MVEYVKNIKEVLLHYAASKAVRENGHQCANEFRSRAASTREESFHCMELNCQFHRETNKLTDQGAS